MQSGKSYTLDLVLPAVVADHPFFGALIKKDQCPQSDCPMQPFALTIHSMHCWTLPLYDPRRTFHFFL